MGLVELLVLLVVGWFLVVTLLGGGLVLLERIATFAGNAWRKLDPKEKARRAQTQEYLRAHPDAIRATWRREWD